MNFLLTFYQFAIILLVAPFAAGFVKFCKARFQGRRGASPFLPYWTILTLMKKQMVISQTTSWIFRVSPFIVFGTSLFLALTVPLVAQGGALVHLSHFVIMAGVLMIGTIFLVLGGLDAGSAFGGMGAEREMTIASLVEPTMILIFTGFALNAHSSELGNMIGVVHVVAQPAVLFSLLALLLVSLAENARYPVDNPATHLELTMVHEAMILEYSGPYLALMEYASFLKLTIFATLFVNMVSPIGILSPGSSFAAILVAPLFVIFKTILMMALLAFLESSIVKMRFYRVHEFLSVAFFLALGGVILSLISITL